MRLTQLKLSGFKSFVDPTSIHVPGQLVGIVGPNGCGKSNVIDAVRWVLGESRASALRGDSMQDVIFNGSGNRKPLARAAVELLFDNSMGRAAGQWSQYAEISVRRVLQRDGESSYYINGTHVRHREGPRGEPPDRVQLRRSVGRSRGRAGFSAGPKRARSRRGGQRPRSAAIAPVPPPFRA